jgi:repressor LexA
MAYTTPGETREKVYRFVRDRILAGNPPTVREVQDALGFSSVQSAREHLEILVREGRLLKEPRKSRSYRLPKNAGSAPLLIPLLGRVPAGALATAVEDLEGYISIRSRSPQDELFALRVRGESMRDVGILPDDIVVVRRQPSADSGDIVVALVEDDATVKRLRVSGGRVELHPENPAFAPIIPDPETFSILGKVVEVRRFLETPIFQGE